MGLTWLADTLRGAGLEVVEHSGWKTHDRPGDWLPRFGVVHATAAPASQADSVQIRVVRDGRSDLPGPIANAVIDRDGRWHVVSAGRCNSTLVGTAGPFEGLGNTYALSTEGCNDNRDEAWSAKQYRSYVVGWAAWCRRLGWKPSRLVGHKEHTPGHKTDPTFNMDQFRRDVQAALDGNFGNEGMDLMLGPCKKGDQDSGNVRSVRTLQTMLKNCGEEFSPGEIDGDYGDKTSAALLKVIKAVYPKTGVTSGDEFGPDAYMYLHAMFARVQALKALGQAPGGGLTLPADVVFTGTIKSQG